MTALAPSPGVASPAEAAPAEGTPFTAEAIDDFAAAEALWRELEATGTVSPYQRFDWQKAYADAMAPLGAFETRVVIVRDAIGRIALLLPLAIERRHGLRVAVPTGGKHANYHLPLLAHGALPPGAAKLRALLRETGRALRLDAYAFSNLPRAWHGVANPLAEGGRPSPSNGYRLALSADTEATLTRVLSKDARKKLRQKDKKLREFGPVAHRVARQAEDVDAILRAFLAQKRERFREMGLPNPFEDAAAQAFLRAAALAGLCEGRPAIELHALVVGDRIVATFGAAVDHVRCCGMFTAFDGGAEIARASPGELLMLEVIRFQCRQGRRVFDLGIGEARYKSSLCDEVEELVDVILPITARGRIYAAAAERLLRVKRFAKQTPWIWNAVGGLRGSRAKAA
jgi:CelD/BcsL family acetyltransferase involved in cellulose biosynthesis